MNKLIYNGKLFGDKWLTKASFSHKYYYVGMYFLTKYTYSILFLLFTLFFLFTFYISSYTHGKAEISVLYKKEKKKKEQLIKEKRQLEQYKFYVDSLYLDHEFRRYIVYKHSDIVPPKNIKHYEKIREKYSIPISIFYRWIWTESKFNHKAISNKGAQGLTQIMPSTNTFIEDNIGPASNLEKGAWYLSSLRGTWKEKLCQYNSGKKIAQCAETRNYVKQIINE